MQRFHYFIFIRQGHTLVNERWRGFCIFLFSIFFPSALTLQDTVNWVIRSCGKLIKTLLGLSTDWSALQNFAWITFLWNLYWNCTAQLANGALCYSILTKSVSKMPWHDPKKGSTFQTWMFYRFLWKWFDIVWVLYFSLYNYNLIIVLPHCAQWTTALPLSVQDSLQGREGFNVCTQ